LEIALIFKPKIEDLRENPENRTSGNTFCLSWSCQPHQIPNLWIKGRAISDPAFAV
jgi:hypothetical protein